MTRTRRSRANGELRGDRGVQGHRLERATSWFVVAARLGGDDFATENDGVDS